MEAVSSGWVRCDLLLMSETNEVHRRGNGKEMN